MTTTALTRFAAPLGTSSRKAPSSGLIWAAACYDLMLATTIIIAGSQGIHRFLPPLLLWALIYAMVSLKYATHFRVLFNALRQNIAIMAFPFVAAISTVWSVAPGASAYAAMQLIVTYMAAIWLGWRYRPRDIALIVLLGLTPLIALSLVNWATGMFGEVYSYTGGLLGIFSNKNTLGRMSLLLGIVTIALLIGRRSTLPRVLVLSGVFVMAALALFLSKSATSAIVMLASAGLFVLLTQHRYPATLRLGLFGIGAVAVMATLISMAFGGFDPFAEILDAFGKSSNLTGRTTLWGLAMTQISETPWLGVGFDAYWDTGAFLAVDYVQRAYGEGLISFHNFVLDIWVTLGVPGLIGIAVTLMAITLTFLRYYMISNQVWPAMALTLLVAGVGVAFFNPLLHAQHGNLIVIFVALAVSSRIEIAGLRKHVPK
ncbi:O-antigen ligase family protein [Roseovarius rhodophyticola]|uniref:O-antigen ligase family protein n=1 Tax=Roseovarius rhodophyticola TaxID=3080827 RepID=A0ABZ2THP3_9RHOB|nr:O-antigen ligase family protein [Roseovarius sp. W115]MDV2929082.1 O-antigen ligase family protein [Roseovarius sp. W115]